MDEPKEAKNQQKVEFRVVCHYKDDMQLQLKTVPTLEEAISIIEKLDPNFRSACQWLVYEATITESLKIVYRDKKAQPTKRRFFYRMLNRFWRKLDV
jgi:hypothetical protein